MKSCTLCGKAKPMSEFYPRKNRPSGQFTSGCRSCLSHIWTEKNKAKRKPRATMQERFFNKIELIPFHSCWEWTGGKIKNGYGHFRFGYKSDGKNDIRLAHRVSYELHVGLIPDGLVLDHLCRNTSCVNPRHLQPVTQRENIARGISPSAKYIRRFS